MKDYDKHSFTICVAKDLGIPQAIMLDAIVHWVAHNAINNQNFFDGCYWTYNSKRAWAKYFPYFTERQVKYALESLREKSLVDVSKHNSAKFDQTLWYTITSKAVELYYPWLQDVLYPASDQNVQCGLDEIVQRTSDKIVQPIPTTNYITTTNNNNNIIAKPRKKSYKNGLDDPDKTRRTDMVAFTEQEYQKMIKKLGSEEELLSYMDWFGDKKVSNKYTYKSDYDASNKWGIEAYNEAKARHSQRYQPLSQQEDATLMNEIDRNLGKRWSGIEWSSEELKQAVKKIGFSMMSQCTDRELQFKYYPQVIKLYKEYKANGVPK